MEVKKAIVTNAILVAKAKEFASRLDRPEDDFKGCNRWLSRFKQQRGIASRKLHEEASSVELPLYCIIHHLYNDMFCILVVSILFQ